MNTTSQKEFSMEIFCDTQLNVLKTHIRSCSISFLSLILLALSTVVIFPYTWTDGSVRIDHYIYSSQAALFATQGVFYPSDPKLQIDFELKDHPLLFRWMVAGVYKIFGISELTSKVLSGLMGCGLVLMIFAFGTYFFSKWMGFFAALFLLISPRFMLHSSLCLLDIPLIFFTTGAICAAIYAAQKNSKYYFLAGICTGLALLTKGPFGLLPFVVIGSYVLTYKRNDLKHSHFWSGMLLMPFLLIFTYTMIVSAVDPNTSFFSFWRTKGVGPYDDNSFFYVTALLKRYFYMLPLALYSLILYRKLEPTPKSILITCIMWCIAVIIPLSFAESKKQGYYLLPLNPALALMCGIACEYLLIEHWKKITAYANGLIALMLALIFSCTPFVLFKTKNLRDQSHFRQYADLKWAIKDIITKTPPLYYEHGMNYVLNFHFSPEYAEGKFTEINDSLLNEMKQSSDPRFLIINKLSFKGDITKLFIVHEMRDLVILSNNAYEE